MINSYEFAEGKFNDMFKKLVPFSGKASTVAGEVLRAVAKISHRFYNDGDKIGVGYGSETCNAPARYLMDNYSDFEPLIIKMWGNYSDDDYEKLLKDLVIVAINYLEEYPELAKEENKDDMLNYWNKEDLDYEFEDDTDDYEEDF